MPSIKASMYGIGLIHSGKADAAIWNVKGLLFGDGFFDVWFDWHRTNHTMIYRKLTLAAMVQSYMRLDPSLALAFKPKEDDRSSESIF